MKLTLKLVSLLTLVIVAALVLDGYLTLQRETVFLRSELERKAYRVGTALEHLIADAWRSSGRERALTLIAAASEQDDSLRIRWVWLDVHQSNVEAASGPQAPRRNTQPERFEPLVETGRLRPVLSGQHAHFEAVDYRGQRLLVSYFRVNVTDSRPGAIELSESLQPIDDFVSASVRRQFVLAAVILIAGAALTAALGIALIGRPLQELTAKAHRAGDGDLSGAIELRGRNELTELADTLNQMCDNLATSRQQVRDETEARIRTLEELRHADRLRTVGQLASGVAHELGTPLNVVSGRAALIEGGRLSDEDVKASAGIIRSQAERMTKIIRQLLDFSRRSPVERADVELKSLIAETVEVLQPLAGKHHVELTIAHPDETSLPAFVDAGQMQQVLTNLIVNALQATPDGGRVTVSATSGPAEPPDDIEAAGDEWITITVEDTGEGIPADLRDRLFEPFFTTKDIGDGTGLGLSIAYGIVQEHGGWIDIDSTQSVGTRMRVFLPDGSRDQGKAQSTAT